MKSKRYLVAAPAILALALAGCGGSTTKAGGGSSAGSSGGGTGDCASKDVFCVGLVTDVGKIDDKSFNQAAWQGVEKVKAATGAQTKAVETTDMKDYATNIKRFTDAKYDVVVTVGFMMTDATRAAAKKSPETTFIGVDQPQASDVPNVTGLTFPEDQAGYAAGYLAGLMTKTNVISDVLGKEIPPVQKYAKGYEAGAKAANPKVKVIHVYHPPTANAFGDPVWGAGQARTQMAQKSDIVFGAGGGTGNGALGEVAKSKGAGTTKFCIGVDLDQWETVPEAHPCLITSAEKKIGDGVSELVTKAKDGSIKGGNFLGKAGLSAFHDFDAKIPADVKTKVADVVTKLADGSLKTGVTL